MASCRCKKFDLHDRTCPMLQQCNTYYL